jgi:hypothetical protein
VRLEHEELVLVLQFGGNSDSALAGDVDDARKSVDRMLRNILKKMA